MMYEKLVYTLIDALASFQSVVRTYTTSVWETADTLWAVLMSLSQHSCFQLLSFCTPQETSMALPSLQQSLVLSSQIRLIRSSLTMSLTQNPKENELRLSARWKGWTALSLKKKKMRTKMLLMAVETRVCKQINNFWFFFFGLALTFNWNSKIFIEVFIEQVIGFYFLWNLCVEQCITYGASCKRIWVFLPVINRQ